MFKTLADHIKLVKDKIEMSTTWLLKVSILSVIAYSLLFKPYELSFYYTAHLCGKDQDLPVCTQQWFAAIGPTIALVFAAYGALQIREQLRQGQSAVIAAERQQFRSEFEVLTEHREQLLEKQRELEVMYESSPFGSNLNSVIELEDLVKFQFIFDYVTDWIGDARREPYLSYYRPELAILRMRVAARSELYRDLSHQWDIKICSDARMKKCLDNTCELTIRDLNLLRKSIDDFAYQIGTWMYSLTSARENLVDMRKRPKMYSSSERFAKSKPARTSRS